MIHIDDFQTKSSRILSIYFCAGCPTLDGTAATIQALQDAGVDMIEVGIPFSDPLADGPIIQQATTAALRAASTCASSSTNWPTSVARYTSPCC